MRRGLLFFVERGAAGEKGLGHVFFDSLGGNVHAPGDVRIGKALEAIEDKNIAAPGRERGDGALHLLQGVGGLGGAGGGGGGSGEQVFAKRFGRGSGLGAAASVDEQIAGDAEEQVQWLFDGAGGFAGEDAEESLLGEVGGILSVGDPAGEIVEELRVVAGKGVGVCWRVFCVGLLCPAGRRDGFGGGNAKRWNGHGIGDLLKISLNLSRGLNGRRCLAKSLTGWWVES